MGSCLGVLLLQLLSAAVGCLVLAAACGLAATATAEAEAGLWGGTVHSECGEWFHARQLLGVVWWVGGGGGERGAPAVRGTWVIAGIRMWCGRSSSSRQQQATGSSATGSPAVVGTHGSTESFVLFAGFPPSSLVTGSVGKLRHNPHSSECTCMSDHAHA